MSSRKVTIRKNKTDYSKIRVTSNGAFYMRSSDIFNNKKESLSLLEKLAKALENYKTNTAKPEIKAKVNA
ncbi:hypothetical protein [Winogradskyella marincola]|uniref:DUF1508 domain-containing protein n=1 Tax=Winogradskyella marincola TaxID=3037795 RepID=A0ABT6FYH1_9FLAO|nr:hypothetical protein [Winogradskyella sp. YYF002]MDG4714831.1 hypothetical protein [Winogradskyella sp. YYF002]